MKNIIWLLIVLLIFVRHFISHPIFKNGDRVRISTTIYSDPVIYPGAQYLKIAGLKTYLPLIPAISYGNKIVVEGIVGNGKLENPKLTFDKQRPVFLSGFRNKIIGFYQNVLPQPESGLLAGIVLGAKGALDTGFYNQTKLAGVAHVVVASGTNITFVVSFLSGVLFIFLSRKKAIVFVILGIILYLFISGFDAPLIRAAIMSSVLFLGQELGRVISPWRIFFLTAGLMLAYSPEWLTDIGFQLSFASTASIMFFKPRIDFLLKKALGRMSPFLTPLLKEDFSTSLAAQIGVIPILFVTFGQINILSPLINTLVLWVVAPLMIIGAVGGAIGLIIPIIGRLILYLGYPMLWWFVRTVEIFG